MTDDAELFAERLLAMAREHSTAPCPMPGDRYMEDAAAVLWSFVYTRRFHPRDRFFFALHKWAFRKVHGRPVRSDFSSRHLHVGS